MWAGSGTLSPHASGMSGSIARLGPWRPWPGSACRSSGNPFSSGKPSGMTRSGVDGLGDSDALLGGTGGVGSASAALG